MQLGKLGVWAAMDALSAADGAAFAQRLEGWGYAAAMCWSIPPGSSPTRRG